MQARLPRTTTILITGKRSIFDTPLSHALRNEGYTVVHNRSIAQALEYSRPDIVIVDAGQELDDAISDFWSLYIEELTDIPCIVVHAHSNPSFEELMYFNRGMMNLPQDTPISLRGLFASADVSKVLATIENLIQHPVVYRSKQGKVAPSAHKRKRPEAQQPWWSSYSPSLNTIRGFMVLAIVFLVALSSIGAMVSPAGMNVLEKVLPILTLSAGYLFGRQSETDAGVLSPPPKP